MKIKTETILTGLKIFAWIAMIGYAIECGSQVISLIVSLNNPEGAKQIPGIQQNLTTLFLQSKQTYIYVMSFVIALSAMKVNLGYLVINLWSEINLRSPFSWEVTKHLEKIAYQLLTIWLVSIIGKGYIKWLSKSIAQDLDVVNIGDEFLFISGIVYLTSQIFKRGIEIQEENQLTV